MSEETVTTEPQGNTEGHVESADSQEPFEALETTTQDETQATEAQEQTDEETSTSPDSQGQEEEIASPEDSQESEPTDQIPADPDGYRFDLPEDVPVDPVLVQGLKRFAFNNKWSQDAMSEAAKFLTGYSQFQHNQRGKQLEAWSNAIQAEWGGKYAENRKTALKGLQVAGEKTGTQLQELLNTSGALNNPAVMKFLHAVGTLMSEDTFVRGAPKPVTVKRDEDGRPIMKFNTM